MQDIKDIKIIEKIKRNYVLKTKEDGDFEKLKALDKKVKVPAQIFAYCYSVLGIFLFGTGMCFAMEVIGSLIPLGIVIGVIGIAMISTTEFTVDQFFN